MASSTMAAMLCDQLGCIFVHVPKTAGSSIESFLLDRLGSDDRAAYLLRPNRDPEVGPPRLSHLTWREYVERGHVTPDALRELLTFAVVRNPWDRVVSMYHYFGRHRRTTFADFVFNVLYRRDWQKRYWFVKPQVEFVSDAEGRIAVDRLLRFEHLEEEFAALCDTLGFERQPLPRKNQSRSKEARARQPYQDFYCDPTRRWVTSLYRADVEAFGYSFDSPAI